MKRESFNLEYKEKVTKTFLKTVSAFANYNDGKIIFGIRDKDYKVTGVNNYKEELLKIENMINDTISPRPNFKLDVFKQDGKDIITLSVFNGLDAPYYYKDKAYKRTDTSTVEVDRDELRLLFTKGQILPFEDKLSKQSELSFDVLKKHLKKKTNLEVFNNDTLKTLNLLDGDNQYNNAAELISDNNNIMLSGVDMVEFGDSINTMLNRDRFVNMSILSQYYKAIEIFERNYVYEEIEGYHRVKKEVVPKEAFREALVNAIIHRDYSINSNIQISMYDDYLTITSPGALPEDVTEEEYLNSTLSKLRNPIIANIFFRLDLIETYGTGISRINSEYNNSLSKPKFTISKSYITIKLPITSVKHPELSEDEQLVFNAIKDNYELSRIEIEEATSFKKDKVLGLVNMLIEYNIVVKHGSGKNTVYKINSALIDREQKR